MKVLIALNELRNDFFLRRTILDDFKCQHGGKRLIQIIHNVVFVCSFCNTPILTLELLA